MRTILALFIIGFLLLGSGRAAVCKGEDPCKACADCSQCRFCDPKNVAGGSCGVVRAQDAAAAKKREAKRAKKGGVFPL